MIRSPSTPYSIYFKGGLYELGSLPVWELDSRLNPIKALSGLGAQVGMGLGFRVYGRAIAGVTWRF